MRRVLSSSARSSDAPPGSERLKQRLSLAPGLSLLSSDASGDDGILVAVETVQNERIFHRTSKATHNFYTTASTTKSPAKRDPWSLRKYSSLASGRERTIFDEPLRTEAYCAEGADGKIDRGPPAEFGEREVLQQGVHGGETEEGREGQLGGRGEGGVDTIDAEVEVTNFPDESAIGNDCLGSLSDKQLVVRGNLVSHSRDEGALQRPELPVNSRPSSFSFRHAAAVVPLEIIAALKIQSIWRGWLQRNQMKRLKEGVVRLQSMVRGNRQFNNFRRILQAVVTIQKTWRQARSVKFVNYLKIERENKEQQRIDNAAIVVQQNCRSVQSRHLVPKAQYDAAAVLQKNWRGQLSKRLVKHMKAERALSDHKACADAAIVLQKCWRGRQSRRLVKHLKLECARREERISQDAVIVLQKHWRGQRSRSLVKQLKREQALKAQTAFDDAAILLQKSWQGHQSRRMAERMKVETVRRAQQKIENSAIVFQKNWRGRRSSRVNDLKMQMLIAEQKRREKAAIEFQRYWRGKQGRRTARHVEMEQDRRRQQEMENGALVFQRYWRGRQCRLTVNDLKIEMFIEEQRMLEKAATEFQRRWRGQQGRRRAKHLEMEQACRRQQEIENVALVFQRFWRGKRSRLIVKDLKMQILVEEQKSREKAATEFQRYWRGKEGRRTAKHMEAEQARRRQQEMKNGALVFQRYWRGRQIVNNLKMQMLIAEKKRRENSAIEFQRYWRGKQGRRMAKNVEMEQARRRQQEMENAALVFQRYWRGRQSRRTVNDLMIEIFKEEQKRLGKAAMEFQRYWRGHQGRRAAKYLKMERARRRQQEIENAALVFQTHWRGQQDRQTAKHLKMEAARREEEEMKNATLVVQKHWRGRQSRLMVKLLKLKRAHGEQQQINSVIVFQKHWRGQNSRRMCQNLRMERARREQQEIDNAVIVFQKHWRSQNSRRTCKNMRTERVLREQQVIDNATVVFQKYWRGRETRRMSNYLKREQVCKELQKMDNAATIIERFWRGHDGRRTYKHLKMERDCREQEHRINMAAIVFQKHWRRRLCSRMANRLKTNPHVKEPRRLDVAALVLQKHWRSVQTRRLVNCLKTERTTTQRERNCAASAIQKAWKQFQSARCAVLPITSADRAMELGYTCNEILAEAGTHMRDMGYSPILEHSDFGSTALLVAHEVDDQSADHLFFDSLDALENLPCASSASAQRRDRDTVLVEGGDLLATLDGEERKGSEGDWNYVPVDQLDECLDTCLAALKPLPLTLSTSSVSKHWDSVLDVSAGANLLDSPQELIERIGCDGKSLGLSEASINGQQICLEASSTLCDVDESDNGDASTHMESGTSDAHSSGSAALAARRSTANYSNVSQRPQQAGIQQHASHQQPKSSRQSEERLKHFAQVFLLQRHIALQQHRAQAAPPFPVPMQSGSGTSGSLATSLDTGGGTSSLTSFDRDQDIVKDTRAGKKGNPSEATGQIVRHVDIVPVDEAMATNQHHVTCEVVDLDDHQQPAVKFFPPAGRTSSASTTRPDVVLDMVLLLQGMEECRASETEFRDERSTYYSRNQDIEEGLPLLDRSSGLRESHSLTNFANSIGGMKRIGIPDVNAVLLVLVAMVVYTRAVCRGVVFGTRQTHRRP